MVRPVRRPTHSLEVIRNGQPAKRREYHAVSRVGTQHELGVYNNSVSTVERALVERYFLCKVGDSFLPPLKSEASVWAGNAIQQFRARVVELVRPDAEILSLHQVVQCYTGPKRRVYENALRSLQRERVSRRDARLAPFTKFEKQSLVKAPRIINPRSPRYNLELGRYLKKGEKLFYKAVNKVWGGHTPHTVIKGLNSFDTASVLKQKWDRFKKPVMVGLDATKYDMHVGVNALKYEHSHYTSVWRNRPLLVWLLSQQIENYGIAYCPDGEVKFNIDGTRCSGDLNTALGNCIIMCAIIYAFCHDNNIVAELANNGDDCGLFIEEDDLVAVITKIPSYFAKFGFRIEVETEVRTFEEVEFCQSHPVLLEQGWCMVRNVRTCLQKDPMCLVPIQNELVWRKWLGAVGECGLASVPGCPVLQSFYQAFVRNGKPAGKRFKERIFANTSMLERSAGLTAVVARVTDEARASFYRASGITPDYQIALEDYFDTQTFRGFDELLFQDGFVESMPLPFLRHL